MSSNQPKKSNRKNVTERENACVSNFDLSNCLRWRNRGSLWEGAPAKRVEEPAQPNPLRFDMASICRLCRRLLPPRICSAPPSRREARNASANPPININLSHGNIQLVNIQILIYRWV